VPRSKVKKVYLYPKPVDFRKSIDGLAALVELDIKVAVFDPVLFVFLNRNRNRVKSSTGSATAFAFGSSVSSQSASKHHRKRSINPTFKVIT
jgi:hypothetical protein